MVSWKAIVDNHALEMLTYIITLAQGVPNPKPRQACSLVSSFSRSSHCSVTIA